MIIVGFSNDIREPEQGVDLLQDKISAKDQVFFQAGKLFVHGLGGPRPAQSGGDTSDHRSAGPPECRTILINRTNL